MSAQNMLNPAEHQISPANKSQITNNCKYSHATVIFPLDVSQVALDKVHSVNKKYSYVIYFFLQKKTKKQNKKKTFIRRLT